MRTQAAGSSMVTVARSAPSTSSLVRRYESLTELRDTDELSGTVVMGALVSKWTSIKFPGVVSRITAADGSETVTTVQNILDSLLPGAAALGLTFLCMYLLRRKVNAIWIILGLRR